MTRKQLSAENAKLKSQLSVHKHETRKALNERVKQQTTEIKSLEQRLENAYSTVELKQKKVVELELKLAELETAA